MEKLLDKYEIEYIKDILINSRTLTEASNKLGVSITTLKRYCDINNISEYHRNKNLYKYDDDTFINICKESSSMREASIKMNIPFTSFIRRANKLGCYVTNQSGVGINKQKIKLECIINNFIIIRNHNLKRKLFKLGIKERKCEICGCGEIWMDKPITLELHHINGIHKDNSLINLQILCPNCHSQTDSYRKRNVIRKKK